MGSEFKATLLQFNFNKIIISSPLYDETTPEMKEVEQDIKDNSWCCSNLFKLKKGNAHLPNFLLGMHSELQIEL